MYKKIARNPYLYIFLVTYYGIWLVWNSIKIPFRDPDGIISYLPSIHYNPEDNIVRFVIGVLLPPLVCLVFWAFSATERGQKFAKATYPKRLLVVGLVGGGLLLAMFMGIVQGSTNPANNPPGTYGGPYSHALVDTFHEGETLGPAISYEQKDLKPYKNFVIVHGVFQDPLRTVIAFKLFGKSIGAERAFSVILYMLAFALYLLLLIVLFERELIKAAAGLAVLGLLLVPGNTLPVLHNLVIGVQLPFRDIATILFLMLAIVGFRYSLARRTRPLAIVSLLIGLIMVAGYANSIDRAFYITALSAVWLVMIFLMERVRTFVKYCLVPFIVGCILGLPILGLALKWDFVDFIRYMLTMGHYKEYLDGEIFTQPNLATNLVIITLGAFVTLGGFWLIKAIGDSKAKDREFMPDWGLLKTNLGNIIRQYHTYILLLATGAFFIRSAIGRPDLGHWAYSIQWLYLLLAYIGITYAFKALGKYRRELGFVVIVLFGFILGYYAIQVKDINIRNDAFPIHLSDTQVVRPDYLQTASFLKANLHGKQSFVTLTSEGTWYYLVNKPSPISYPIIWYAFTAPQRQSIANQIQANSNIKYIVTNNNWTSDFDYVPNPTRFPEVYKVLYQLYKPKVGIGQQTIWERNSY